MEYRFQCQQAVRWVDIDSVGVLNNAVYLTLVEQARYEYFAQLDLLEDGQFPFVLAATSVRFLRPGRAGMVLTIAAKVTLLGSSSLQMHYEVRHERQTLAALEATVVYVDQDLKSRPIPERTRGILSEFEGIAQHK
jgi:acyl-CoA thioester hydrolase